MASLNELRKQVEREKSKQLKLKKAQLKVDEKTKLKKQLFNLKYGSKIRKVKGMGRSVSSRLRSAGKSFSSQRKKKQGVGGFLQRIADNQRY